jgi:thiamine biosynthesis lipoprotein
MHRRDFLDPRRLAQSAGQLLGAIDELRPESSADPGDEVSLLHLSRRAMATNFELILPFGTPESLALGQLYFDEIDRLEAQLTVYRDTSEVSRLNALAFHYPIPVEEGLFELLALAARLTSETRGAFDVTAGALIKAWGFYKGPRRVPPAAERAAVLECVGMHHVELDAERRTVRFLRPGLEINLGSIGKGYALDRAAEKLRREGNLAAGLLHGGQSSVYAIGKQPGDERGWPVALRHPWEPERSLGTIYLSDQALATSAATFQYLEHAGRKLGHILDPRTGWPAEGMASVSVVAPTAAEADALATAFYILGVEAAQDYCEQHPALSAVLLPEDNATPMIVGFR